jgi:membrane protease YdiL (CAAX protease family)
MFNWYRRPIAATYACGGIVGGAREVICRRPLRTFAGVAFAFTAMAWTPAIAAGGVSELPPAWQLPQQVLPVFGPWLGALVVSHAVGGTSAVRSDLRSAIRLGGAWRSVLVAAAVAAVVAVGAVGINRIIADDPIEIEVPTLASAVLAVLVMTVLGGGQEEPGWRGFALPRLEARFGRVAGTVVLAVMWGAWHLPLWLVPDSPQASLHPATFLLHLVPYSMIFTWLWHHSGGSVPLAMLFHGLNNALAVLFVIGPLGPDRFADFLPSLIIVEWLVAFALTLTFARVDPFDSDDSAEPEASVELAT